jgi:hypothetical protein
MEDRRCSSLLSLGSRGKGRYTYEIECDAGLGVVFIGFFPLRTILARWLGPTLT